jgi:metallo-beta-lactamase family protein
MVLAQFDEAPGVPVSALTRRHRLADGEVTLLGAYESVTGAMTRVEIGGQRLLIDCGKPQGAEAFEWEMDATALDVDAVLLTNAQLDHVGSLPALLERGFAGPIYGTPATLSVARLVLEDALLFDGVSPAESGRIMAEYERRRRPLRYDQRAVLGDQVEVVFREAGFMLGSASIEVTSQQSRVVLSGNLGRPGSPLMRDYNTTWKRGRAVDLVLMESTYGDEEHAQGQPDVERELERIFSAAAERGGNIVVPAFAVGGAQALLHHLHRLVEARRVPLFPVALDSPTGLRVTHRYGDLAHLFERQSLDAMARGDEAITLESVYGVQRSDRQRLSLLPGPLLIIAGHAMCTGGRIVNHLRRLLPLEQTTVLFLGYQAEGTPGRAIQRAATRGGRVWIDHEEVRVRAHVETSSALSGHADRRELARWLGAIPDVQAVALHQGEPKAQRAFAAWYG